MAYSQTQFRSLTGIEPYTFLELVARLRPHWRERIEAPKNRSGRPWGVGGVEDHLLVLLILYRCAITQDFMACLYQTNKSTINRSLRRIEAVAARVLGVTRVVHVSREEAEALISRHSSPRPSTKGTSLFSTISQRTNAIASGGSLENGEPGFCSCPRIRLILTP